jgi:hypothetical protein
VSGGIVKGEKKQKETEQQIEANRLLPALHKDDSPSINFRKVLLEWEELGFPRMNARSLELIAEQGYDAFFIDRMNVYSKIGLSLFHRLAAMGRIEITAEYLVFHYYRNRLKADCRRRIAILLASKTKDER